MFLSKRSTFLNQGDKETHIFDHVIIVYLLRFRTNIDCNKNNFSRDIQKSTQVQVYSESSIICTLETPGFV